MIETIKRQICDVCEKEVEVFAGSLELKYAEHDWAGNGAPVKVVYKDICIDCCRKLDKAITKVLKEVE